MVREYGSRRRLRFFAFAIAAFFGALAFASYWSTRENLREGSKEVFFGADALRISHIPETYRAVFRSENRAGGELVLTTDRVWVRRPFASRVETYSADGKRLTLRQSNFGALASSSSSSEPLNITVPPSLSSGDLRIDAVLKDAVEEKTILRRERREVYGRQCQVYRAGGPVLAGDITPYKGGTGTYTDFCIDRNGIVIEEYWVQDDKLLRRRVATDLDVGVPIAEKTFTIDVPEAPGVDRGAIERISEDASDHGSPIWVLPKVPRGFKKLGRYGVVITSAALTGSGSNPLAGANPITSISDVYVDGADLVVVDQDPSLIQASLGDRPTRKVELGDLREGMLVVDGRMSELRGTAPGGSVVRIVGTLPPHELIELARSLEPQEG